MTKQTALVIFGPTASGKSSDAIKVANKHDCTIINADSLQIYKDLRILTSRPSIQDERKNIHKLYGILSGGENCSVSKWLDLAKKEIKVSLKKNKLPIIVGGTGMYIKGLIDGISPIPDIPDHIRNETQDLIKKNGYQHLYNVLLKKNKNLKIKPNDKQRIQRAYNVFQGTGKSIEDWHQDNKKVMNDISFKVVIKDIDRDSLYKKCEKRFDDMISNGGIDEVSRLLDMKYDKELTIMKAIGVREIAQFLKNEISLDHAILQSKQKTRNYIKRQLTWIKGNNITQNDDFKKYI